MLADFEEVPGDAGALVSKVQTSLLKGEVDAALAAAVEAKSGKTEAAALRAICRAHLCTPGTIAANEAAQAAEQAIMSSKRTKDDLGEAAGLRQQARAQLNGKKYQDALKSAQDALAKFQGLSSVVGEAAALVTLADVYLGLEMQQKGLESATRAADLFKKSADADGEAVALRATVDIAIAMKKFSQATAAADKLVELFKGLDDQLGQGIAKLLATEALIGGDEPKEAAATAGEAAILLKSVGASARVARALRLGAEAKMIVEPSEAVVDMAERAQMISQRLGDKVGQATAMVTVANICNTLGDFGKAAYKAEAAAEIYLKLQAKAEAAAAMRTAALVQLDRKQYDPEAKQAAAKDALRTAKASKRLYEEAGDQSGVGYAGSLQTLASAYLATEAYDDAMSLALESKEMFLKLEHSAGAASALNTIAQVHFKRGDKFEAVSTAKDAENMFKEAGDEQGAYVSAYLAETFEASKDKDAAGEDEVAEEGADGEKKKKDKPKPPTAIKSVSGLADLIPGNPNAVTILAAYDAYEGRSATTPGQRRQASDKAGVALDDSYQAPSLTSAVFTMRWLPAKPRPEPEAPSKRSAKRLANKVVTMQIASGGEYAPAGIVPVMEKDLTALD